MKKFVAMLGAAVIVVTSALAATPAMAANSNVSSATELTNAITAASPGDIITLTSDFVVEAVVTVSKAVTIDGGGYTISVPKPGVSDAGANISAASAFGVFSLSGSNEITLKNMKIKGGNTQGAGVKVGFGTTAVLDSVTISNSRYSAGGGGGIYNGGTTILKNSNLMRNSARYGGGFLNPSGKTMYVVNSTVTDNRSESSSGGGGGAENQGTLYINNSTFANNSSTEIGGAVNNYTGTLYVSGSSFTGNVAYGSYGGGALGNNGGTIKATSSLFAYNYSRSTGTVLSPTSLALDDVGINGRSITTGTGVTLYYSVYHASSTAATLGSTNTLLTGSADGSDNSIFTGGSLGKIRDGAGAEIGAALVYKPLIASKNGRFAPALKVGSFAAQKGTPVRFDLATGKTSYFDRLSGTPVWSNLTALAASTSIDIDQYGEPRNQTLPAAGSVEIEQSNLYQVRAVQSSGGTVNGASVYGDVYPANTTITVTAVPDAGNKFDHFTVTTSATSLTASVFAAVIDIPVTTNPLVYNVTADAVVTPVFVNAAAGERTVSYAANNATCGQPPSSATSSTTIVVAGNTSSSPLQREGYSFSGWNTEPNSSGTNYAAGDQYSTSSNLNLSAKWVASPGVSTTCFTATVPITPTPSSSPTPSTISSSSPAPSSSPNSGSSIVTTTQSGESISRSERGALPSAEGVKADDSEPKPADTLRQITPSQAPLAVEEWAQSNDDGGINWWLIAMWIAIILILIFFFFLIARRRKRSDEDEQA